jgi:hypothetical protein
MGPGLSTRGISDLNAIALGKTNDMLDTPLNLCYEDDNLMVRRVAILSSDFGRHRILYGHRSGYATR